jgi:hypothetical protein
MELAASQRVIPLMHELAQTRITWEDCDQLAMSALEPIVRKEPVEYLATLEPLMGDAYKWVRRPAITVIGRMPMKQPAYTERCLHTVEPALGDDDLDGRRALSFAIGMRARGDPKVVSAFIERQADHTDPATIWALCDVIRSRTEKFLPHFRDLLPRYEKWLTMMDARSQRIVVSAIKVLRLA